MEQNQKEQQPRPAKKKMDWKKYLPLIVFIPVATGFIVLGVVALHWTETLKVQRVVVDGANHLQAKEIVSLSGIQPQANLAKLDCRKIEKKLQEHPLIKHADVACQLPDAMRIKVVEREPFAAINDKQILYVDSDGVLLPRLPAVQFDLPLISGVQQVGDVQFGHQVPGEEIGRIISVLKMAQEVGWYHLISEIKLNEANEIVLFSMESGVPILLGKDRVEERLLKLQTFWNNFVKNGNAAFLRYVDLRFDGEVVVKWDKRMTGQATKYQL